MSKITQFFTVFSLCFVVGCSKNEDKVEYSATQLKQQLVENNGLLAPHKLQSPVFSFPFDGDYLQTRNRLYDALIQSDDLAKQPFVQKELALLKIEQRFTERYLPWPAMVNVIDNFVLQYLSQPQKDETLVLQATEWVNFVTERLKQAELEKIKLNQFELLLLQKQVSLTFHKMAGEPQFKALSDALITLNDYLSLYKIRKTPGLVSLPNGKEWYQARINYFTDQSIAPLALFSTVIKKQNTVNCESDAFMAHFLAQGTLTSEQSGFDWRTGYQNRLNQFQGIPVCQLQLIFAEIDLGLHSQSWSLEHANSVLQQKSTLTDAQNQMVIAKILLEPGLALININEHY